MDGRSHYLSLGSFTWTGAVIIYLWVETEKHLNMFMSLFQMAIVHIESHLLSDGQYLCLG